MISNPILLQKKYTRVITLFARISSVDFWNKCEEKNMGKTTVKPGKSHYNVKKLTFCLNFL